jgi:hypothetical protein
LKRDGDPTLLANVEGQAKAVHQKRRLARRTGGLVDVTTTKRVQR